MNIAICFSGQIRTGIYAAPNIKKYVGDLWNNCTFFCHTWNINTRKPYNCNGIPRDPYVLDINDLEKFAKFYDISIDLNLKVDDFLEISQEKLNICWTPMQYSWRKSVELFLNYQSTENIKFDFVIKLRPDILLEPGRKLILEIESSVGKNGRDCFFTEQDYGENFMDDVIYFSVPEIMDVASTYAYIEEKRGLIGLKRFLKEQDIKIRKILKGLPKAMGYTIMREESIHRNPINGYKDCFDDDFFYYAPK